MNPQAEAQNDLNTASEIEAVLSSKGWLHIHKKLQDKIFDLQSIRNILSDSKSNEQIVVEMQARNIAINTLVDWLRVDIYGFVETQARVAESLVVKKDENDIINRT